MQPLTVDRHEANRMLTNSGIRPALAAADLVDEYRLIIYPFAVGSGTALFAGVTTPRHLELEDAVAFPSASRPARRALPDPGRLVCTLAPGARLEHCPAG
jgi:RibD C-terminal domain